MKDEGSGGSPMRLHSLWFALGTCTLTLAPWVASVLFILHPSSFILPQELSKADALRAQELHAKAVAFGRAGKYAEAQGPVREILELRTRVQGKDHYETADARREIEALK